jgi:hypothetical protein
VTFTDRLERLPAPLKAGLREPLTHFLLIGALLFGGGLVVEAQKRPVIVVNTQDVAQMAEYWELQSQRPPTRDELAAMVRERVDEEILAREAQRLGLDRDDLIIRRRLAQKMAFAGEDVVPIPEPSARTLEAFYDRTRQTYAEPAHLALRHVYFSEERTEGDPRLAARAALDTARQGQTPVGDPFMLSLTYADVSATELLRDYGPEFARAAETAPLGTWIGPVASPFGWHVVRVETRRPARIPPLQDVKSEVRDAYMAEQRQAANAGFMAKLRQRYRIEVAEPPA